MIVISKEVALSPLEIKVSWGLLKFQAMEGANIEANVMGQKNFKHRRCTNFVLI